MSYALPKPIGKYVVGIEHISFEYFLKNEKREIPVHIYYPSDNSENKVSFPYGTKDLFLHNPNAEDIALTTTYCYEGVKISDDKESYPLVIFSTGFGCFSMLNTVLCSDLASSGFIVASIGHPGDEVVYYPNGKIQYIDENKIKAMTDEDLNKKLEDCLTTFDALGDKLEAIDFGRKFFSYQPFFNDNLELWLSDTSASIDYFEGINLNKDSGFYNKINFNYGVSVAGHSYGGAAAVDITRTDKRIVCGINIDGGNFGHNYAEDIKKPFLSLGNPHIWGMLMGYTYANTSDSYFVGVLDGEHMGFTDSIYFGQSDRVGTRDKDDYRKLVSEYCLSFLNSYQLQSQKIFHKLNYANTKYFEKTKIK